ncbi:MAG: bifunctional phosphoglucose/phosphomannose isomerase [Gemmatimonadota bacterium]
MTAPRLEDVRGWRDREPDVDTAGMRGHIEALPRHLSDSASEALETAASISVSVPSAIAVVGMGGSAIGGDLVAAYTAERRRTPLVVVRGYELPTWLDDDAWVIASSYSGNTEETLSAYAAAKERGLRVVAITTGGRLGEQASADGDPVFSLPGGFPPRAALGHSFATCAVLTACLATGLEPRAEAEAIADAGEGLGSIVDGWLAWEPGNPALIVAAEAVAALPLIYSGHPLSAAAGRRWKTQLNENAKLLAHTSEFPEHNHNEIVGFEPDRAVPCAIFYLQTAWDHERVRRRMGFVRDYLDGRAVSQRRVEAGGDTPLEAMLRLCLLGDCASFLASVITGRDPTPVASIDALKRQLSSPSRP